MKFRKKPVEIEAIRWTGENWKEVKDWMDTNCIPSRYIELHSIKYKDILLSTLEGPMVGAKDDWIILGVKGEVYACKPDIFEMTYESVEPKDGIRKIILNGREIEVDCEIYAYEGVVKLAGMNGEPSVTYRHAHPLKPEGILAPNQVVRIKEGTIFNVAHTGGA